MTDAQIDTELLQELIEDDHDGEPDPSKVNVAQAFVARFFEALGWNTKDPSVWNRQSYVRGAGYADAALQIGHEPVLFVEVKRFGGVARPQEDMLQLFGKEPILSQVQRAALGIDRTPEEKQAMRYARGAGIRWAVLTNFERLLLFNADEERVVLAFDAPEEYLERLDDLEILAPVDTQEQFNSQLQWYADLQKKAEIDEDFYRFLSEWRLRLAQTIYDHNQGADSPLHGADGEIDLGLLRQAVQRTLDRLIIIRYADDVGFLEQHDLLENELAYFLNRQAYTAEYRFHEHLNDLYDDFYRHHDTTIFAPDHVCEQVRIPNDALVELVRGLSGISFRKFSSDILGNTYESYLGQRLVLEGDTIRAEGERALRKESGIYYTPSTIVRYVVDHTLGRWLYGTADGRPPSHPFIPLNGRERGWAKTLADLDGLRVLDPAMGSGSFLIYAFEVLADFYECENERIRQKNAARWDAWGQRAMEEGMFGENDAPDVEEPAPDYVSRILQEHLYGVDLDPEAVEIAAINLILRAFARLKGERKCLHPPLILGQNLKEGNSLIGGVTDPDDLAPFEEERRRLIVLREELGGLEGVAARARKLDEIEAVAAPMNAALNKSLEGHFDDVKAKRPFNWEIAFPEAFDPVAPKEKQGFTIVVGNPPWVSLKGKHKAAEFDKAEANFYIAELEGDSYRPNLMEFFVRRAVDLTQENGLHSFVVPDRLAANVQYSVLRENLLNSTSLLALRFHVPFPEVIADTLVYVLRKASPLDDHEIRISSPRNPGTEFHLPQTAYVSTSDRAFFSLPSQQTWKVIQAIEANTARLDRFVDSNVGFIARGGTVHLDKERPEEKPVIKGQNVERYKLSGTFYFDFAPEDLVGGTQDEEKLAAKEKVLLRKTGDAIIAAFDSTGMYPEQSVYFLHHPAAGYDLRYFLTLLNSTFGRFYYRNILVTNRNSTPQLKKVDLDRFPIPKLDNGLPQHNSLVELAQRMIDLNETRRAVTDGFAEAIRGYEHTPISLRGYLNEQLDLVPRQALLDANEEGEVSAISVDEARGSLLIRAEVEGAWRDVARLGVDDEDMQLYLLLALRAFLHEHRRKYVWSRGKILNGVLEALDFPCLDLASSERNQRRVARAMDDVRRLLPDDASASELPHHGVGLDREGAPLHLSAIEADLNATDAEIDRRVYDLYGLTNAGIARMSFIRVIEGQMES